jgi:hypothetical protein
MASPSESLALKWDRFGSPEWFSDYLSTDVKLRGREEIGGNMSKILNEERSGGMMGWLCGLDG